jgi:hypothetical protein
VSCRQYLKLAAKLKVQENSESQQTATRRDVPVLQSYSHPKTLTRAGVQLNRRTEARGERVAFEGAELLASLGGVPTPSLRKMLFTWILMVLEGLTDLVA